MTASPGEWGSPCQLPRKPDAGDLLRIREAVAEAEAMATIHQAGDFLDVYWDGGFTTGMMLELLSELGARAERNLLTAWWPFHDLRAV